MRFRHASDRECSPIGMAIMGGSDASFRIIFIWSYWDTISAVSGGISIGSGRDDGYSGDVEKKDYHFRKERSPHTDVEQEKAQAHGYLADVYNAACNRWSDSGRTTELVC